MQPRLCGLWAPPEKGTIQENETVIAYHGTPISGPGDSAARILANRDAMVSFFRPDQVGIAFEVCRTVALDNGAFSAWRTGNPVTDWEGYYEFVRHWHRHPAFAWAIIPDVIDGSEAQNNQLIAEWPFRRGVPVWHMHESLERLGDLADRWPLVALGSSGAFADVGSPHWWRRMAEAMDLVCDEDGRPVTKFHGLRMLDPTVLAHLPLHSADSTNVARNVGLDAHWKHPYAPKSKAVRASVIMDRLEWHAKASRWCGTAGTQRAFELLDYVNEPA